jgi:hypothetical protein
MRRPSVSPVMGAPGEQQHVGTGPSGAWFTNATSWGLNQLVLVDRSARRSFRRCIRTMRATGADDERD